MLNRRQALKQPFYTGTPLESGGTSIKGGGAAPALKLLLGSAVLRPGIKVLDYGAGKYGRNSDWLRDQGLEVYAYDPFNGSTAEPAWANGQVSTALPRDHFDTVFTCFVLNVVPKHIEDSIVAECEHLGDHCFHIVRNQDVAVMVENALRRGDHTLTSFYEGVATPEELEALEQGQLSKQTVLDLCHHGVQTSKGFQRIPRLEDRGYTLVKKSTGYKIYLQ